MQDAYADVMGPWFHRHGGASLVVPLVAAGVSIAATSGRPALIGLTLAVLLAANVGLFWWVVRKSVETHWAPTVLAVCWILVALVGMHNFSHRATTNVVSQVNVQTGVELGVFGVAGVAALVVLRAVGPPVPLVAAPLVALPVWVVASAAWSDSYLYAAARGAEFGVLALLASATIAYGMTFPRGALVVLIKTCRMFVLATSALILAGLVFGPAYVRANEANIQRFTWPGAFPTSSAIVLGVAMAILIGVRPQDLRFSRPTFLLLVAFVGGAIYANQTRTTVIGIGLCLLLRLGVSLRGQTHAATIATTAVIGGGVLGAGAISEYVLRDGDVSRLWTLNGRTDIWPVAAASLHGPVDWLTGLGYGASRVVFLDEVWYASTAHNSFIGALVDIGLIGVLLLIIGTVGTLALAVKTRQQLGLTDGLLTVSMMSYIVLAGLTSDTLVTPGLGSSVVYLNAAVGATLLSRRHDRPPDVTRPGTVATMSSEARAGPR